VRAERTTQMNATMDRRGNATKTLYAALTPEQQKAFDAAYQKRGARGERVGHAGAHHRAS